MGRGGGASKDCGNIDDRGLVEDVGDVFWPLEEVVLRAAAPLPLLPRGTPDASRDGGWRGGAVVEIVSSMDADDEDCGRAAGGGGGGGRGAGALGATAFCCPPPLEARRVSRVEAALEGEAVEDDDDDSDDEAELLGLVMPLLSLRLLLPCIASMLRLVDVWLGTSSTSPSTPWGVKVKVGLVVLSSAIMVVATMQWKTIAKAKQQSSATQQHQHQDQRSKIKIMFFIRFSTIQLHLGDNNFSSSIV